MWRKFLFYKIKKQFTYRLKFFQYIQTKKQNKKMMY